MDSLIVLRRPLRKTQLGGKYTDTRKSRKSAGKVEPIPTEPGLATDPLYAADVCFARLWRERGSPARAPAAARPAPPHPPSPTLSLASLPAHHRRQAAQPRAQLVLELDYTTSLQHSTVT